MNTCRMQTLCILLPLVLVCAVPSLSGPTMAVESLYQPFDLAALPKATEAISPPRFRSPYPIASALAENQEEPRVTVPLFLALLFPSCLAPLIWVWVLKSRKPAQASAAASSSTAASGAASSASPKKRALPSARFLSSPQLRVSAPTKKARPAPGPAHYVMDRYGDDGARVHDRFDGEVSTLKVYDANYPSLYFNMFDSFNAFLAHKKEELRQAAMADPGSVELANAAQDFPRAVANLADVGLVLRLAGAGDPEGVGFVQWQIAFYCDHGQEGLTDLLKLLDSFTQWKIGSPDFGGVGPRTIAVHNHTNFAMGQFRAAADYQHYTFDAPNMPEPENHIFSVFPPEGQQVPIADLHIVNDGNTINASFRYGVYKHRAALDTLNVPGGYRTWTRRASRATATRRTPRTFGAPGSSTSAWPAAGSASRSCSRPDLRAAPCSCGSASPAAQ